MNLRKLIEEEINKLINEAQGDTPNVFWLVFGLYPAASDSRKQQQVEQLANRELIGVKGISGNKNIVTKFLGLGRNAILIMPANKTIDLNHLTKIEYDDIDQLLADNMKLLYRIWSANPEENSSKVITNILNSFAHIANKSNISAARSLGYSLQTGYLSQYDIVKPYTNSDMKINDLSELTEYFINVFMKNAAPNLKEKIENLNPFALEQLLKKAILESIKNYETEGEWIINSDHFKIPGGSNLLVTLSKTPNQFPQEIIDKIRNGEEVTGFAGITREHGDSMRIMKTIYQYNLDKIYNVKFVSMKKFEDVRMKLWAK